MTENEKIAFHKKSLAIWQEQLGAVERLFNYGSNDIYFSVCNNAREEIFHHYVSFPQARQILEALHKVILDDVARLSKLIAEWEKNAEK